MPAQIERIQDTVARLTNRLKPIALLTLRLTVGIVFIRSGWGKLHNLGPVIEFFRSLGIPGPELQAPFVAGTELIGGVLLLVGLASRLVAIPLTVTMVVAILTAKREEIQSLFDVFGFSELDYIVFFFAIIALGPGLFSIDHLLSRRLGLTGERAESLNPRARPVAGHLDAGAPAR